MNPIYAYQISSKDGHIADLSTYEQGLEILAFPCNQFNQKEPGNNAEITQYCKSNFHVTFPMFDKIEVTGTSIHPLFCHLVEKAAFQGFDLESEEGRWMVHFVC